MYIICMHIHIYIYIFIYFVYNLLLTESDWTSGHITDKVQHHARMDNIYTIDTLNNVPVLEINSFICKMLNNVYSYVHNVHFSEPWKCSPKQLSAYFKGFSLFQETIIQIIHHVSLTITCSSLPCSNKLKH